jgi:hypothetical protein
MMQEACIKAGLLLHAKCEELTINLIQLVLVYKQARKKTDMCRFYLLQLHIPE